MTMSYQLSKNPEDLAEARLTEKQSYGIKRLSQKIHGSKAAAVRMAIDAGLRQLDPEYASSED